MNLVAGRDPEALRAMVTLNGVKQELCVQADDEVGFVDVMTKHRGQLVTRPHTERAVLIHRLFGEVKITLNAV